MIEVIALLVVLGAFRETAKRRGVRGWPFIIVGLVGWLLFSTVALSMVEGGPEVHLAWGWVALSWGWVGLTYISIFFIGGGGRRMKESWQCPECHFWNSPTTLVCLCGYEPAVPETQP